MAYRSDQAFASSAPLREEFLRFGSQLQLLGSISMDK